MERTYLQEAFKALDALTEAEFNLSSTDGIDALDNFINNDDGLDELKIIDDEAETEEDLQDNYIGKVILNCNVCNSKIYKDPEEVTFDDETGFVNVDMECPFCYSTDGFKLIGEVAPYVQSEEDEISSDSEEIEDEDEDDVSVDVQEDELEECNASKSKDDTYKPSRLKEAMKKVSVETEDKEMTVESDDAGKIVITSEDKADEIGDISSDEEVIAPISDETQSIMNPVEDDVDTEDNEDENGEGAVDVDFDDFSEEEFDELGESYLKENYSNVETYKTTNVRMNKNNLIVEGVITFNSGNKGATQFIFEGKDITRNGKLRLIGENKQLNNGKSYTLTGHLDNKKLIVESLNYNYKIKDEAGNAKRIFGTKRINKK